MKLYKKNRENKELKKILVNDFWEFIRRNKYYITISLNYNESDIGIFNEGLFEDIIMDNSLTFKDSLYIDFNITILERFMEKFLDKEDIIDIKLSNGFFIIPIEVILHSLNITKEELIKYKKKE